MHKAIYPPLFVCEPTVTLSSVFLQKLTTVPGRMQRFRRFRRAGCRARECSLLCIAKSIPCCRARQSEHCRARTWRVWSRIGAVLCPAARGFQCAETVLWRSGVSFAAKWRMRSVSSLTALRTYVHRRLARRRSGFGRQAEESHMCSPCSQDLSCGPRRSEGVQHVRAHHRLLPRSDDRCVWNRRKQQHHSGVSDGPPLCEAAGLLRVLKASRWRSDATSVIPGDG
jgi:hypothetical protein